MKKPQAGPVKQFEEERRETISAYKADHEWAALSAKWLERAFRHKYMYNFSWLGRPIIQLPADILAFQELVWRTKPDLIIETGIAHGGSLVLSASMLALLDYCDAVESGSSLDPQKPKRQVLGIDIDIRAHNRKELESHPLINYISMIEGSSVAPETTAAARGIAAGYKNIMVCLDSNHVHDHVLAELEIYAPFVSKGSYCIVFDTIVEDLPDDMFPDRPWSHGNNPKTALYAYLDKMQDGKNNGIDGAPLHFEIDKVYEEKLLLNATPDGFLKRI